MEPIKIPRPDQGIERNGYAFVEVLVNGKRKNFHMAVKSNGVHTAVAVMKSKHRILTAPQHKELESLRDEAYNSGRK